MASPLKLNSYDVVIAGGGTAGCVLASRLTEDPDLSVLLLEAGGDVNNDPRVSIPGLASVAIDDPDLDWQFKSEPNPGLKGRRMAMPRGKCLGGSSAINLMALIVPSKAGVDAWEELGNPGWNWEGLAPYYRKSQRYVPPSPEIKEALALDFIDPKVQGTDGPICSSYPQTMNAPQKAWVDTWKALEKSITGDPLSGHHVGGYTSPASVDPEKAERTHAGNTYLASAMSRENLHIVTGAMIDKVEMDTRDPKAAVATGVTFTHSGQTYTARANREVIISAGSLGSPPILERSGIGSRSLCETLGIKNVIDNPNVGENLQDHMMGVMCYETKDGVQTLDCMRDPAVQQAAMQEYQSSKTGPLAGGAGYGFAYTPLTDFIPPLNSEADLKVLLDEHLPASSESKFLAEQRHYAFQRRILESPDEASAIMCFMSVQACAHKENTKDVFNISEPGNYISVVPALAHSFSRGSVHIENAKPEVYPKIHANYLSHPLDAEILARHMMQAETLMKTPPFADLLKPDGRRLPEGYDALTLERAREMARWSSMSNWHAASTCAMQPKELGGVVNERLIVHGTENLRVCDASIFPIITRGNIQSTVYAVAEKGADIVKEDLRRR